MEKTIVINVTRETEPARLISLRREYESVMLYNFQRTLELTYWNKKRDLNTLEEILENRVERFAEFVLNSEKTMRDIKIVDPEKVDNEGYYKEDGELYLGVIYLGDENLEKNIRIRILYLIDNLEEDEH